MLVLRQIVQVVALLGSVGLGMHAGLNNMIAHSALSRGNVKSVFVECSSQPARCERSTASLRLRSCKTPRFADGETRSQGLRMRAGDVVQSEGEKLSKLEKGASKLNRLSCRLAKRETATKSLRRVGLALLRFPDSVATPQM